MNYKVVFLQQAEYDIKELKSYIIKNFSQDVWKECYAKIKSSVNVLKEFPQSGKIPHELEELNINQYKQLISGMNRIIYELRQEMVFIHIVCDSHKDMKSLLMKRLLR